MTLLTTICVGYRLCFYKPITQGVTVSDIYIVDAEYYMLASGAGELVQNPGTGDVETPVREAARGIPGASSVSASERAGEAIDSRCRSLMADIGQFKSDVEEAIKSMAGTDQESAAAMDRILEHVKGYPKAKPGSKGKARIV
ncbi:hypothetical protein HMPREF0972_00858 [Actinomyces sp. oral taxon 848 str. F0332]|nr:hypothetical protein HMPREF0972_00858 [Actinomyces sp. oral taxon 848 str. F0332]